MVDEKKDLQLVKTMTIANSVIKQNATALTPSGGTDLTFAVRQRASNGAIEVMVVDDPQLTRRSASFLVKPSRIDEDAPSGYTQNRNSVLVRVPITLSNGKTTVNTAKVEIATDIETSDAQRLELRYMVGQILSGAGFALFWDKQATE